MRFDFPGLSFGKNKAKVKVKFSKKTDESNFELIGKMT